MKSRFLISTAALLLQLAIARHGFAVSEAGLLFLLISPSPQANGMGGVFTTLGNDDPMGPIYNPAILGILAQKNFFIAGLYPQKTSWLPSLVSDMSYSSKAFNAGFNLSHVDPRFPISLGVGYNQIDLDLGEQVITGEEGPEPLGTFHSREGSKAWTFSTAVDFYVRASVGWSFKHIESNMVRAGNSTVTARDFGLLLQLPVFESLQELTQRSYELKPGLRPLLTPAFAYSKNNMGGKVIYAAASQTDPLPRVARIGLSFEAGFDYSDTEGSSWKVISFEWGTQAEDLLVERYRDGSWIYRGGLGDIDFFHDVIQGRGNNQIVKMRGWGLNLFEAFYLRKGRYEDPDGRVFYDTDGFGIRLAGLVKLLRFFYPTITSDNTVDFITRHIDVQYSSSAWDTDTGHPLSGTKFHGISIVVR